MTDKTSEVDDLRKALVLAKNPEEAGDDLPEPVAPSLEHVLFDLPLYSAELATAKDFLVKFRRDNLQVDGYCIYCEKEVVFKTKRTVGSGSGSVWNWMFKPTKIWLDFYCQRNTGHIYEYAFVFDGKSLIKFGQFPSLEDIAGAGIRKYEKLLPKGYYGELKRAGGLASHGIGIGSFVYLRRIFEKLVQSHRMTLEAKEGPIAGFDTLRMAEKIQALKSVLPPALVANKSAYSILSKGIHELDEETCRAYFPVLRQAIIAILDQDLMQRRQQEEADALQREISKINSLVSLSNDEEGEEG